MTNLFNSLSTFLKGENDVKVNFGLDTTTLIKAGIILIISIALSTLIVKIIK